MKRLIILIVVLCAATQLYSQTDYQKLKGRWDLLYYRMNNGSMDGIGFPMCFDILSENKWIIRRDKNGNKKFDQDESDTFSIKIVNNEIIQYIGPNEYNKWSYRFEKSGDDLYLILKAEDSDGNLFEFTLER